MDTLRFLLKTLVLPPAGPLLLIGAGWWILSRRPRTGQALVCLGLLSLVVLSMPACGGLLSASLATMPPLPPNDLPETASAIVVLGGDTRYAVEFESLDIGPTTLYRIRYAAWLHRATGLPVLATGGLVGRDDEPVGRMMARVLESEFGVPVRWVESASRNTAENASLSAPLLRADGVDTILLVTSGYHMPRAVPAFEAVGLRVIAAPTNVVVRRWRPDLDDFVPRAAGLAASSAALHEWLGRVWYALARWVG